LEFVLSHIELVLGPGVFPLKVLNLLDLDINFSLETCNFFIIVANFRFHLCLSSLQLCDFVGLCSILVIELLINGLKTSKLRESALVLGLQVTMN